ncbi:MAG: hypothetical protein ACE5GM_09175, partial [bacterium]
STTYHLLCYDSRIIRAKKLMIKSKLPVYWEKIKRIYEPSKEARLQADRMLEEYRQSGHLELPPRTALSIDLGAFILFYVELHSRQPELLRGPAERNPDSSWMLKRDFCFFNVRSTGVTPESTGTFMEAVKLLPVIRCDAFHLAPFFDCALENLYAIESLHTITDAVVDLEAEKQGLSRDEQLSFFIDACHLLDKATGFDLEPHTGQFSRVVLEHPRYFRWIKLSGDKKALAGNLSMEEMTSSTVQDRLVKEVENLVQGGQENGSLEETRKIHARIISLLIDKGYWTIPSHTWNGAGLPRFRGYHEHGYPLFEYRNVRGEPHDEHAFGNVTPFKFYDNLPVNSYPSPDNPPVIDNRVVDFFLSIFPQIRKDWDFDFVRLDYADHIFDARDPEHGYPLSDRMIPPLLKDLTDRLRLDCPGIGVIAEHMGEMVEDYAREGVNLVLGWEIFSLLNDRYASDNYRIAQNIGQLSGKQATPASIMFAVDTHDSENPLFWKEGPAKLLGARGLFFRLFWARFGSAGNVRRPKYEVIGNQDLSSGLYEANNKAVSLSWKNHHSFNRWYHRLENVYDDLRGFLEQARITPPQGDGPVKYWFIEADQEIKRLICVAYAGTLDPEEKGLPLAGQFERLKAHNRPVSGFELDPLVDLPGDREYCLTEIDLLSDREEALNHDSTLIFPELSLHEVKLIKVV